MPEEEKGHVQELPVPEDPKKPPVGKRSFVSEEDIAELEGKGTPKESDKIPPPEVTLLYIANHVKHLEEMMAEYLEFFKKNVSAPVASSPPPVPIQQPQQAQPAPAPQPQKDVSPRVAEIKLRLGELSEMLNFDDESSAQYVIVRPKQFLGSENFAKIASTIKNELGGQYVSAGKGSHFLIPKQKAS
jgi:hypothetical protein